MVNLEYDVNFYIDNMGIGVPFNCNVIWKKDGYRENWKESLVGWLHSGVITYYFTALGGMKLRGNGELTQELLKKIPIPKAIVCQSENKRIESIVSEIINIVKKGYGSDTHIKLDNTCWNLFTILADLKSDEVLYRDDWKRAA